MNAEKIGAIAPFAGKEESRTWFGSLMHPLEEATRPWIPPPDPPSAKVEEPPPPPPCGPPDPETSKAWREKLERRKEAKDRRNQRGAAP